MIKIMLLIFSLMSSNIMVLLGCYLFFKKGKSTSNLVLFFSGFAGIITSVVLLYLEYSATFT